MFFGASRRVTLREKKLAELNLRDRGKLMNVNVV
jgi:hypothetical protein